MQAARIIAFVPARDLERAKTFYVDQLGLELRGQDAFALVLEAGGTLLRVAKVGEFQPAQFTVLGFDVANIEQEVTALRAQGITCERYPDMLQDEKGIWKSPSGARVAWFKDADGNVLSLTEFPGGH